MVKSLKCLNCGADLLFNPTIQKWKCEWCDSEYEKKDLDAANINVSEESASVQSESGPSQIYADADVCIYACSYCGAEVLTDNVTSAAFCVYCQRPVVMTSQLSGEFKPSVIIPFHNTKEQALNLFKNYLKGKRFLPNEYKSDQNIEKLTGVYLPFWLYDGDVSFTVHGEGDIVSTRRSGDYVIKRTDVYSVSREGQIKIDNIPVDASKRTPDDIMDSIEPFNFAELSEFSTHYLSGFLAERYDEDKETLYQRAKTRFEGSAENTVRRSLSKYSSVRRQVDKKRVDNVSSKYGLLPVWLLFSKYKEKPYTYAANGQTDKITGNLPIDAGKVFTFFLIMLAIFAAVGAVLNVAYQLIVFDDGVYIDSESGFVIWVVVAGLLGAIISTLLEWRKHKPVKKATNADYYVKEENVNMSLIQDVYLRSHETRTKTSSQSSGGKGGRSSGGRSRR